MLFWSLGHNWSLVKDMSFCPSCPVLSEGKAGGCSLKHYYSSHPLVSCRALTLHLLPGITMAGHYGWHTVLRLAVQTGRCTCEAKGVHCTSAELLLFRMCLLLPRSSRGLHW